jgi:hypothetical protein
MSTGCWLVFNFSLPVYEVRSYYDISMEGDFRVIQTFKSKWVLDNPSLSGTYAIRRLKMRGMKLPYKLYPMNKRITTLSQLVQSKAKFLIDTEGKLLRWVKTKLYPVEVCRVVSVSSTSTGAFLTYIRGFEVPLLLEAKCNFVSIINVDGSPVLFDLHETRPENPRHRVKL